MDTSEFPTLPLRIRVRVPKLEADDGPEDPKSERLQPLRPLVRPVKEPDPPREEGEGG